MNPNLFEPYLYGKNCAMRCNNEEEFYTLCIFLKNLGRKWLDDVEYCDLRFNINRPKTFPVFILFNKGRMIDYVEYRNKRSYNKLHFDSFDWHNYKHEYEKFMNDKLERTDEELFNFINFVHN